jgi:hypothetical protein
VTNSPTATVPTVTTEPTARRRRLLDGLALAVSLLDLVLTLRAVRRRAASRRPLYRDGVLPRDRAGRARPADREPSS